MRNNIYVRQIFEEGLATIFYQKPKKYIEKKLDNLVLKNISLACLNILYILFVVIISILIFEFNFPL